MPLTLTSTAFNHGDSIPTHRTEGADHTPLAWCGLSSGTQSLALAQVERVGTCQKRK